MIVSEDVLKNTKTAIRENDYPMFTDEELISIISSCESVDMAIYKLCIMKSENTQLAIAGMTSADTSKYFLRLSSLYRPNNTGVLNTL